MLICRTETRDCRRTMPRRSPCSATSSAGPSSRRRDKEFSIYEVPLSLVDNKLDELIVEKLNLTTREAAGHQRLAGTCSSAMRNPAHEVTIAVVGKYIKHHDAYKSVYESLDPRRHREPCRVHRAARSRRRRSSAKGPRSVLGGVDGVAGSRRLRLSRHRRQDRGDPLRPRERQMPFFGICLGLQVRGDRVRPQRASAWRTPTAPRSTDNCRTRSCACSTSSTRITHMGGTHAARGVSVRPGGGQPRRRSRTAPDVVHERHRHRYEFNNAVPRRSSPRTAWSFSGTSPDGKLVEVIELPDHPWFVAVQCHPEFKSKPTKAHPLFRELREGEPVPSCRKKSRPRP